MPTIIRGDKCILCGACAVVCPVHAISKKTAYEVDAQKCTDCGRCAGHCVAGAIEESKA